MNMEKKYNNTLDVVELPKKFDSNTHFEFAADCSVFIIPNSAAPASSYMVTSTRRHAQDIAAKNKITGDPLCCQIWAHSEDCENLSCHYPTIKVGDGRVFRGLLETNVMPVDIFRGHKEGETVVAWVPFEVHTIIHADGTQIYAWDIPVRDVPEVWVKCSMKLEQLPYRYGRAPFQDVLEHLITNAE